MKAEEFQDELTGLAQPLVERKLKLTAEIVEHETELGELRKMLRRVDSVLRQIDPALVPTKEEKKEKPKSNGKQVSEQSVETVRNFLRDTPGIGSFTASQLTRDYAGLPSHGTLNVALARLHESGEIALTGSGQGGSKIYKVVA